MIAKHTTNKMHFPIWGIPEANVSPLLHPRPRNAHTKDILKYYPLLRRAAPDLIITIGHISNAVTPYW
ncbi:MAG: hypothetical protein QNI88_14320, partial [Desulfobacterales bacterium]|nr:hypothetical protein [Desulfobacterales bacterium]